MLPRRGDGLNNVIHRMKKEKKKKKKREREREKREEEKREDDDGRRWNDAVGREERSRLNRFCR